MELMVVNKNLVLTNPNKQPLVNKQIKVKTDKTKTHQYYIQINELPFVEFKNEFTIPDSELDNSRISFALKVMNKQTRNTEIYKSDPITAQNILFLGDGPQQQYPETLNNLVKRLTELERKVKLIAESVVEIGKRGEWL
jgi:hypothetical protein